MNRALIIQAKLTEVSEDQWRVIMLKCKKLINQRTYGRTTYGAHCEARLGVEPFDYYFKGAVEKLYEGIWDWKFEEYSLTDQLLRIIGSMVSDEVRKYRKEHEKGEAPSFISFEEVINLVGFDPEDDLTQEEFEAVCDRQIQAIEEAVEGDIDMENLFLLKLEGKTSNEICEELEWKKSKLYKVTEKMKNRTLKIFLPTVIQRYHDKLPNHKAT